MTGRQWWQRYWWHKAACPVCGRLVRIGVVHSRQSDLVMGWEDGYPSYYWVLCEGRSR